jgi:hypothetical protein
MKRHYYILLKKKGNSLVSVKELKLLFKTCPQKSWWRAGGVAQLLEGLSSKH